MNNDIEKHKEIRLIGDLLSPVAKVWLIEVRNPIPKQWAMGVDSDGRELNPRRMRK